MNLLLSLYRRTSDHVRDILRLAVQSLEAGPSSGSKSSITCNKVTALGERNTLKLYWEEKRQIIAPGQGEKEDYSWRLRIIENK